MGLNRMLGLRVSRGLCLFSAVLLILGAGLLRADEQALAGSQLKIRGLSLEVSPAMQTVPVNILTQVQATLGGGDLPSGMIVRGELRGPGITGAITLSTSPGQPFTIPGLSVKGTYTLEDIRLEKEGKTLIKGSPESVSLTVLDIVVTSVTTRPLTLEEIQQKGIVVSDESYRVYNFSVGFLLGSEVVQYEFPVIYNSEGQIQGIDQGVAGGLGGGALGGGLEGQLFNLDIEDQPDTSDDSFGGGNSVPGLLIFNNRIAFLNQFFSIMFLVSNNAPGGSTLKLENLQATLTLPGELREAKTVPAHIQGTPIPVRSPGPDGKIGTADDVDVILATFSGMAEFLAEGLKEGTHTVKIDFTGEMAGLATETGKTKIKGSAVGTVLVRNPEFSVTFAHPSVVRSGEEYDIFVTLANTSPVPANLLSLTLPKSRLIGTELLSDERVEFTTLPAGESATAKYHLRSLQTGKVSATAFAAEGPVKGSFVLTAGVGEQNIPLSPDTLVLPSYTKHLPSGVIESAMLLLGEAYSIAMTPPTTLPIGLPNVDRKAVVQRVRDLAEAGQRIEYGETLLPSLEVLALDWLGNGNPNLPFDTLRRLTSKGKRFAEELAKLFEQDVQGSTVVEFQKRFARTVSYRAPFLSVLHSSSGSSAPASRLRLIDRYSNRMGSFGRDILREIPYGEFFRLNGLGSDWSLLGHRDSGGYRVEVVGVENGTFNLSLVLSDGKGVLQEMTFTGVECRSGSVASIRIGAEAVTPRLSIDWQGDGQEDQGVEGTMTLLGEPELTLIGAVQETSADPAGHAVALLFNRDISTRTGMVLENYSLAGKNVFGAFLQASKRIVVIGLDSALSPFKAYKVKVSGVQDLRNRPMSPATLELPVRTTMTTPGGEVYGRVFRADGTPMGNLTVRLSEREASGDGLGSRWVYSKSLADSDGNYSFDFVRMLSNPFHLTVQDPSSGKSETVTTAVRQNGQRVRVDIVFRGRGMLRGQVLLQTSGAPVPNASVWAQPENALYSEAFKTYTDSSGSFLLSDVPAGRVVLGAQNGALFGSSIVAVKAGETTQSTLTLTSTEMERVQGRVVNRDGTTPVVGTTVSLAAQGVFWETKTDAQGCFLFPKVPIGAVTLSAIDPRTHRIGGRATGTLTVGNPFQATIVLRGTGALSGKVLSFTGDPEPNILVYVQNTSVWTRTDGSGSFRLEGVPVGDNSQVVLAVDEKVSQKLISASFKLWQEGEEARVTLVFPDSRRGGIAGKVYRANGSIASGVDVVLADGNYLIKGQKRTGDDGSFSFSDLPPGHYTLVSTLGNDGRSENVSVQFPGHYITKDIHFLGLGKVRIHVMAADGQSGVMANVRVVYPIIEVKEGDNVGLSDFELNTSTDVNGNLTLEKILVGNVRVEAFNAFYPFPVVQYQKIPAPGGEAVFDLVMKPTGKIQGKVLSPGGGSPVSGAKVCLKTESLPLQTLFADQSGSFEFSLVPFGSFTLEAEDTVQGYKGDLAGSMGIEGQTVVADLVLRGRGRVVGTVKNQSGLPVAGISVNLSSIGFPDEVAKTVADGEGRFTFEGVCAGNFSLEAKRSGVLGGGRARGTLVGNGGEVSVEILLEASGSVEGRVFSPDGSQVVANSQVVLSHEKFTNEFNVPLPLAYGTTDEKGVYRVDLVPAGRFFLDAFDPVSGRKGKGNGRLSQEGERVVADISLEARGSVEGIFLDGSGDPIPGAKVFLEAKGVFSFLAQTTTDGNGCFRFDQVGVGTVLVEIQDQRNGLAGRSEGAIEYEGQNLTLRVRAESSGIVRGRVLRSDGTTPVANAPVLLTARRSDAYRMFSLSKNYEVVSDGEGRFLFPFVPLTSFTLQAREQEGFDRGSAQGTLTFQGQELEKNILFLGVGTLRGRVFANGEGAPNVTVTFTSSMTGSKSVSTDSSGSFEFLGIPVGRFSLGALDPVTRLGASGGGEISENGQTLTLDLTLSSYGRIRGRILRTDGVTPAARAAVTLTGKGHTLYASTGEDGSFAFSTVTLGSWMLRVQEWNGDAKAALAADLASPNQELVFDPLLLDGASPSVLSLLPASGSTGLPLDTTLSVTFSEGMDPSSLTSETVIFSGPSGVLPATRTLSADRLTLVVAPHAPLQSFSLYTLTITDQATDIAGNRLSPFSSSFLTRDLIPPRVLSSDPAHGASGVRPGRPLTVTFSEPVSPEHLGEENVSLTYKGSLVPMTRELNAGSTLLTLTPALLETDGEYTLVVRNLEDFAGNVQTEAFQAVFFTQDTTPPGLTLTPPAGGTKVKEGSLVKVTADAPGASKVYFFLDGVLQGSDDRIPFEWNWKAPLIGTGSGTCLLEALAVDPAGNQSERKNISFTLLPDYSPKVTLNGPASLSVFPGQSLTFDLKAEDDVSLTLVEFLAQGGPVKVAEKRSLSQASYRGNFSLTLPVDTPPGTKITVLGAATDTVGSRILSSALLFEVPADTQPPTVSITTPAEGARFKCRDNVSIIAQAEDDVALRDVAFFLDDQPLFTDTTAPYEAHFTAPLRDSDTPVRIRVLATDLMGKQTAAEVGVVVEGYVDDKAPKLSLKSPSEGLSVYPGQVVKLVAEAEDDVGVNRVEFSLGGQIFSTISAPNSEKVFTAQASYTVPGDALEGTKLEFTVQALDVEGKSVQVKRSVSVLTGVVIPAGTVLSAEDKSYDGKSVIVKAGTVTINGKHTFLNMMVAEGGIVTHSGATITQEFRHHFVVTERLSVASDGKISADGKGYLGGHRDSNNSERGMTLGNVAEGSTALAGGSHGGYGGKHNSGQSSGKLYGSLYEPLDLGGGGGGNWTGGNGGGAVRLEAEELVLDGVLSADGEISPQSNGGAGGSLWVKVGVLKGTGSLQANGGKGNYGYGGGGGRVALYYREASGFDLNRVTAYGGNSPCNDSGQIYRNGGVGTVYLKGVDQKGVVRFYNNGLVSSEGTQLLSPFPGKVTALGTDWVEDNQASWVPGSLVGASLKLGERLFRVLSNTAVRLTLECSGVDLATLVAVGDPYSFDFSGEFSLVDGDYLFRGEVSLPSLSLKNSQMTVNGTLHVAEELNLQEGSLLTHSVSTTTEENRLYLQAKRISVDSTSRISADGKGYLGGNSGGNTDRGRTLGNLAEGSTRLAGGSHGGYGGKSKDSGHSSGKLYGSLYEPMDLGGGGGGNGVGGNGGGAIRLEAEELVLDGVLSADGLTGNESTGGAGGSLWVKVGVLRGNGSLQANGGIGKCLVYYGGFGGGGGRVALYYREASSFDLNRVTAYGGNSPCSNSWEIYRNGSAGTVYLKGDNEEAQLILHNRGLKAGNISAFPVIVPAQITVLEPRVLTFQGEGYMPGSLVGMELIPDLEKPEATLPILANGKNTITVATGDLTQMTEVGKSFAGRFLLDGHLIIRNTTTRLDREILVRNLSLLENSLLEHSGSTTTTTSFLCLRAQEKVVVDSTSRISTDGKGYSGGHKNSNSSDFGMTLGNLPEGSTMFAGGSHGGYGGKRDSGQSSGKLYGSLYEPVDLGGGGGCSYWGGGNGGGAVRLEAEELVLDGVLSADGESETESTGGAGGSLWVKVGVLSGTGSLQANGGKGNCGYGGGGGRVALYYREASGFDLSRVTAYGGGSFCAGPWEVQRNGSAGTVYLKGANQEGVIRYDNNGLVSAWETQLPSVPGKLTALGMDWVEDSQASWAPVSLVGASLKLGGRLFRILSNTAVRLTLECSGVDLTTLVAVGDSYSFDFSKEFSFVGGEYFFTGDVSFSSLSLRNSRVTVNGTLNVAEELILQEGSLLTHSVSTTTVENRLSLQAKRISVDSTSRISADGKGYLGGFRDSNDTERGRTLGNVAGSNSFSGGSHGGYGGYAEWETSPYGFLGKLYGSLYEPMDLGEGGGGGGRGGNGGGAIRLEAEELILDGVLSADGESALESTGGAGGSLWIKVGVLKGTGSLQTNGGSGKCVYEPGGSGGGGGRVALYYREASGFDLNRITAYGGDSPCNKPGEIIGNGGAGTVYLKGENEEARLILHNRGLKAGNISAFPAIVPEEITALEPRVLTFQGEGYMPGSLVGMELIPNLEKPEATLPILANGENNITVATGDLTQMTEVGKTFAGRFLLDGHLVIRNTTTRLDREILVRNLSLLENSLLEHSGSGRGEPSFLHIQVREKVVVDSTSRISADGKGNKGEIPVANVARGKAVGKMAEGGIQLAGGSHGGYGGKYDSGQSSGRLYGSLYEPVNLGGGGGCYGYGRGGDGGGAVRLEAEELALDGILSADGESAPQSTGGAGGSLWVKVGLLKGTGSLQANGGLGKCLASYGGFGGGGGRVALYYREASGFDLSRVTAYGGNSPCNNAGEVYRNGGAGTVYLKGKDQEYGDLIVDNLNRPTSPGSTSLPAVGVGFNTALEANVLTNSANPFLPGALVGMRLNPYRSGAFTFPIIRNTHNQIFTDPAAGEMTQVAQTGHEYIGVHLFRNVIVRGQAHLLTPDRIVASGAVTVEAGSTLKSENLEK